MGETPGAAPSQRSSALPLAPAVQLASAGQPGAGIQRDFMVGGTSGAMDGTPAVSAAPPAISANSTPGAETGGTSGEPTQDPAFAAEELAERVARRVLRTLAVEGERRGLRPWL